MIYIHNSINATVIDSCCNEYIEYLLIKITIQCAEWHVLAIYRPHGNVMNFLTALDSLISKVNQERLIISGDMNINLLDSDKSQVDAYLDVLTSFNMAVINDSFTRFNPICSTGTVIDHVILNRIYSDFCSITSSRTQMITDHNFILFMLQCQDLPKKIRKKKIILKTNNEAAASDISKYLSDLVIEPETTSANEYFNIIHNCIIDSTKTNSTKIAVKFPSRLKVIPKWADRNYCMMLNSISNLEEKICIRKQKNLPHDKLLAKIIDLDRLRERYGQSKAKLFFKNLEIKNNYHAWQIINELIGRSTNKHEIAIKSCDGAIVTDPQIIVDTFQNKFISIVGSANSIHDISNHIYIGKLVEKTFCFSEVSHFSIFNQRQKEQLVLMAYPLPFSKNAMNHRYVTI